MFFFSHTQVKKPRVPTHTSTEVKSANIFFSHASKEAKSVNTHKYRIKDCQHTQVQKKNLKNEKNWKKMKNNENK